MTFQNKRLSGIVMGVLLLLLVPLVAMQFTDQVVWSGADFLIAAILLLSAGLLCEFVLRNVHSSRGKIWICVLIVCGVALVWIELAVGLFGTPLGGN